MDDEIEKDGPKIYAENNSIVVGEINIRGNMTGNITIGHLAEPVLDARLRHELGILLKNVETTWIKGVLEKSVHEAALLELGLELREEAIDNPWRMVMEAPDQSRETLPRGRKIKDIFDEANRLLLMLGEPGSGKTTTLLQLARDLIAEVDSAFTQPVPVILNLSTWTNKGQPLDEWMITELNSKYRVPKKDGQRWLKERRILALLDGLDEVRAENRPACVEKINQLVTDYGLQGLVVCSRIKDYTALNVRLAFYRAIYIQPLSPEQVDEYLELTGDKLASLRTTLQADDALRSMAQSPLILNILSLAYQNTSADSLSNPALNTDKARRKHLFDTYITRMFNRKAGKQDYDTQQTKQRLSWLARNMQKHNQEVFLIESLQPTWLPNLRWQWAYFLVSRLIIGISFALGVQLVYVLPTVARTGFDGFIRSFLMLAVSISLPLILIDGLRFTWLNKRTTMKRFPTFWWSVVNFVVVFLVVNICYKLTLDFWVLIAGTDIYAITVVIVALMAGSIFGTRGSQQTPEHDIQAVEALTWSWSNSLKGAAIGVGVGLVVGAIYADQYGSIAFSSFRYGLGYSFLGAILGGISRKIIETKSAPNQGIRLSVRNAIFGALIVGLSMSIGMALFSGVATVINTMAYYYSDNVLRYLMDSVFWEFRRYGLPVGSGFALVAALWYGGFDIFQHFTLRVILLIQGHTPANYARFLDYAVERIFLQKVGGGYRFIHRLLLEHFAEMGEMKKV